MRIEKQTLKLIRCVFPLMHQFRFGGFFADVLIEIPDEVFKDKLPAGNTSMPSICEGGWVHAACVCKMFFPYLCWNSISKLVVIQSFFVYIAPSVRWSRLKIPSLNAVTGRKPIFDLFVGPYAPLWKLWKWARQQSGRLFSTKFLDWLQQLYYTFQLLFEKDPWEQAMDRVFRRCGCFYSSSRLENVFLWLKITLYKPNLPINVRAFFSTMMIMW